MENFNARVLDAIKPPEGMIENLRQKGLLDRQYIIYRCKNEPGIGRVALCHCTACDEFFGRRWINAEKQGYGQKVGGFMTYTIDTENPEDYWDDAAPSDGEEINEDFDDGEDTEVEVHDGDTLLCPSCHTMARASHFRSDKTEFVFCMSVHRVEQTLLFMGWRVERCVDENGQAAILARPWEAYGFGDDKKAETARKWRNNMGQVCAADRWHFPANFVDKWGDCEHLFGVNKAVFLGTSLENAKLEKYAKDKENYLIAYLKLYLQYQSAENLVMQDCGYLVDEYIKGGYKNTKRTTFIDWARARPNEMLGVEKWEFAYIRGRKMSLTEIFAYKKWKEAVPTTSHEEQVMAIRALNTDVDTVLNACRAHQMRALRRLLTCKPEEKTWLRDYWHMMAELGQDMADAHVLLPPNIKKAHDTASKMKNDRKDAVLRKDFAKLAKLLRPLSFEHGGIVIRAASGEEELRDESNQLGHCVWSYGKNHCAGKCIFFVRRADAPTKSWYTLQLDTASGRVVQNRGKGNCAKTKEVQDFEDLWISTVVQPWIADKKRKKTNKKAAAKAVA